MPFQVQVQPSGRQFAVNEGETLLEAGIRQNMGLPYGCKDGACGSCKCQKISGEVVHKPYQPSALTQEELAFYDALTKPENIKDFYQNNELIDLTRELTEMLRKNRTIDWQKKETARASMRKMVKHLLKKYKYPPEDYDTAISTVISQCEMWTDNMTA